MRILINGVPPYDGSYDVDGPYTMEQIYSFRVIADIRPADFGEALTKGDVGLIIALAKIGLERESHNVILPVLWSAPAGRIMLDFTDEGDADPPPQGSDNSPPSSDAPTTSSGSPGSTTGDSPSESDQSGTGTPSSASAE